ncbi:cadherin domain-containing protein [Acuticoccus kandeliae]|uniref:cadherin domain-containing protein n=1 Tax=Acuticoccus kandeliae TaxID=2073160 RepID=UPI000D3E5F4D|nr:cadherin domain-containing protein [Acuticoccus kandeliae]
MITIDASTASSMNFEAFLAGGFLAGTTSGGFPVFDNGAAFAGEEMMIAYGTSASSPYVLAHGQLEYYFDTHTVWGEINTIEFGTRGSGTFDGNGYFTGGDVDLRITGLTLANAQGPEAEVEANGPVHNFAIAYMYGSSGDPARLSGFLTDLDNAPQTYIGSPGVDVFAATGFADSIGGGAGNDTLTGEGGNDTIDGGAGTDTAVFSGTRAQYTVSLNNDGSVSVTDSVSGRDGADRLTNIERLAFSDGTVDAPQEVANGAPTSLVLTGTTVAENAAEGTVVGTLSATDPDGDALTYSLVSDAGGRFAIVGNTLLVAGPIDYESATRHSVTVDVTDTAGNSRRETFVIAVTDVAEDPDNTAPANLTLSASTVAENAAPGTVVGLLSATDADGDALTYTLVGDGGPFRIVGNELRVSGALDHESDATHSVTVRVSDGAGHNVDKAFTIAVGDVDEAPGAPSLSATTVLESAAPGTVVGTLSATDPEGGALTYSLAEDAGGLFRLATRAGGETVLVVNGALDFETAATHQIAVEVRDAGGNVASRNFAISVSDVPEADGGMITIDASNAGSMDFEAFIGGEFLAGTGDSSGFPVFDNSGNFAGEEMMVAFGEAADSPYVTAHGDLGYFFGTHTVYGEINTIEYGTRGDGAFDADGYFVGGDVILKITGLDLANAREPEAEVEANGPVHNFAVSHMYGAEGDAARLQQFLDDLDASAQHYLGSAGTDVFEGSGQADLIEGGAGDDSLSGIGGNDTIDGGEGTDTARFTGTEDEYTIDRRADGSIVVTDSVAGRDGTDTLLNVEILAFADGSSEEPEEENAAPTDLTLSRRTVSEAAGIGTVVGILAATDADGDALTYALVDNPGGLFTIVGDELRVAASLERVGTVALTLSATDPDGAATTLDVSIRVRGDDTSPGGSETPTNGDDVLAGSAGAEKIDGLAGDDSIAGRGGDDLLVGGDGADTLGGGPGDDRLLGNDGDDAIYGGDGNDLIAGHAGDDVLSGGAGEDTIHGGEGDDRILGRGGDDALGGGAGDDLLRGDAGADTLAGHAGEDILVGGEGADSLLGGADDDALFGGGDADSLDGGNGNDMLRGEAGDDWLAGGHGDDTLRGGEGADVLDGGVGDDILIGGEDADRFVFGAGSGDDSVLDYAAGVDVIDLTALGLDDFAALDLAENGHGDTVLTLEDGTVTLRGVALADLGAADFLL